MTLGLLETARFGPSETAHSAYWKPRVTLKRWNYERNPAPTNRANRRVLRTLANGIIRTVARPGARATHVVIAAIRAGALGPFLVAGGAGS